jgi:hypothetical protein
MLGALDPGEAETLVRLLGRVAETLNAESIPVSGAISSPSQKGEP